MLRSGESEKQIVGHAVKGCCCVWCLFLKCAGHGCAIGVGGVGAAIAVMLVA